MKPTCQFGLECSCTDVADEKEGTTGVCEVVRERAIPAGISHPAGDTGAYNHQSIKLVNQSKKSINQQA